MSDEKHEKYMRDIFEFDERTEHKGVLPAKDRIKQYRTKNIKRSIPSAAPGLKGSRLHTIQSTNDLKVMPGSAKEANLQRPTTAAVSHFGMSDAPTAISAGQTSSLKGLAAMNNRAISISRFSKFEESEKAIKKYPFGVFYTSNEPTSFHKENRFEGRGNFMNYFPTGEMHE